MISPGEITALVLLLTGALAHAAALDFPELRKETRAPADGKSVIVDFPFTNKTSKPVTITKCDTKCACLTVRISGGKFTYAPGESGVVRTTMELGNLLGKQEKSIDVWLDKASSDKPSLRLDLIVDIPALITLEPKTVYWGIDSKPEPKTIRVIMDGGKPINITNVTGPESSFRHELKTVEAGKKYDIIVTPLDTKIPVLSVLKIDTDCEIPKHKTQQAFTQVRKLTAAEVASQP
jgi:hypothetical protein